MDVERFIVFRTTPTDDLFKMVHKSSTREKAVDWLMLRIGTELAKDQKTEPAEYFVGTISDMMKVPQIKLENILMNRGNGRKEEESEREETPRVNTGELLRSIQRDR